MVHRSALILMALAGTLVPAADFCAGAGQHRIVVMTGNYFLTKAVELDAGDNGLPIKASEMGQVTLYGGRLVSGRKRDGDNFMVCRITQSERRNLGLSRAGCERQMAERTRMPASGTFLHRGSVDVP